MSFPSTDEIGKENAKRNGTVRAEAEAFARQLLDAALEDGLDWNEDSGYYFVSGLKTPTGFSKGSGHESWLEHLMWGWSVWFAHGGVCLYPRGEEKEDRVRPDGVFRFPSHSEFEKTRNALVQQRNTEVTEYLRIYGIALVGHGFDPVPNPRYSGWMLAKNMPPLPPHFAADHLKMIREKVYASDGWYAEFLNIQGDRVLIVGTRYVAQEKPCNLPRPTDVLTDDESSRGYVALMEKVVVFIRDIANKARVNGYATDGWNFYGSTWPSQKDMELAVRKLAVARWEASIKNESGRDPAVLIEMRPVGGWPIAQSVPSDQTLAIPSPEDVNRTIAEQDRLAFSEADEYLAALVKKLKDDPPAPDSEGWGYFRTPLLPRNFIRGSVQWGRVERAFDKTDWTIDIWSGSPRDPDHVLRIRAKNG